MKSEPLCSDEPESVPGDDQQEQHQADDIAKEDQLVDF